MKSLAGGCCADLPYTFPDIQLFDINDALNIKKLKFGIIPLLKFKIPLQDCLKNIYKKYLLQNYN